MNLIMVFICVILWNNYVVGIGEITDDSSTCQRVAEVPWETPGGRVQRRREGGKVLMWEGAQ